MEFVTLEQIAELQEAARNGCLYSLAQLEQLHSLRSRRVASSYKIVKKSTVGFNKVVSYVISSRPFDEITKRYGEPGLLVESCEDSEVDLAITIRD